MSREGDEEAYWPDARRGLRWEGTPRLWKDPKRGPWAIRLAWIRLEDGREWCVGLQMQWADPQQPESQEEISSTLLRSVPLGTMIARQRRSKAAYLAHSQLMTTWLKQGAEGRSPDATDDQVEEARLRLEGRRGRPGRPPTRRVEFYATVAAIYADAYARGENPTLAVAQGYKRLRVKLSRSAAAKAVAKTRRLGLLGPTERGKAGGTLPIKGETQR
jgi:hypothetical protein